MTPTRMYVLTARLRCHQTTTRQVCGRSLWWRAFRLQVTFTLRTFIYSNLLIYVLHLYWTLLYLYVFLKLISTNHLICSDAVTIEFSQWIKVILLTTNYSLNLRTDYFSPDSIYILTPVLISNPRIFSRNLSNKSM